MALLTLGLMSSAQSQQTKDPGLVGSNRGVGTPIVDDAYDGTLGSMTCLTSTVAAGDVEDVEVDIAMNHTWVGDLTIKVVSPSGTVNTLMSRPGFAEAADDGTGCCGDSSNMVDTSLLTFAATGGTDAETMGTTIANGNFVCQDDGFCSYLPNPGAGMGGPLDTFFDGEPGAGLWQVCVGDAAAGDLGDIVSVAVRATLGAPAPPLAIPSLNIWGLTILGGLFLIGGGIYARRRQTS